MNVVALLCKSQNAHRCSSSHQFAGAASLCVLCVQDCVGCTDHTPLRVGFRAWQIRPCFAHSVDDDTVPPPPGVLQCDHRARRSGLGCRPKWRPSALASSQCHWPRETAGCGPQPNAQLHIVRSWLFVASCKRAATSERLQGRGSASPELYADGAREWTALEWVRRWHSEVVCHPHNHGLRVGATQLHR